jgi:hypothetical protein
MITCFIHWKPANHQDLSANLDQISSRPTCCSHLKFGHFRNNLFLPATMFSHFHPHLDVIVNTLIAQAQNAANSDIDTDILAKIQVAWKNFLESGQAGAMTVGVIAGYVVRGITK